jgi:hypothetical protein
MPTHSFRRRVYDTAMDEVGNAPVRSRERNRAIAATAHRKPDPDALARLPRTGGGGNVASRPAAAMFRALEVRGCGFSAVRPARFASSTSAAPAVPVPGGFCRSCFASSAGLAERRRIARPPACSTPPPTGPREVSAPRGLRYGRPPDGRRPKPANQAAAPARRVWRPFANRPRRPRPSRCSPEVTR